MLCARRSTRCGVVFPFLFHAPAQVHRKGDLGDESDGLKGDTIKLLSDDDGSRKRGVSRKTHVTRQFFFFSSCLLLNLFDGKASCRSLDDKGDDADCVRSFDETAQMLSHAGVNDALERRFAFLFLLK